MQFLITVNDPEDGLGNGTERHLTEQVEQMVYTWGRMPGIVARFEAHEEDVYEADAEARRTGMADTFDRAVIDREYDAGIDIDGVAYSATALVGEAYSAGSDTLHDVVITIPALAPWMADRIMRAISEQYVATVSEEVG